MRRLSLLSRMRAALTSKFLELVLMSRPTTLYDKIWDDHLVH